MVQLAAQGNGKVPWLLHVDPAKGKSDADEASYECVFIDTGREEPSTSTGTSAIPWLGILRTLKQQGIESVMIEGGATIISALLCMPELVNSVIVTIAPTWLGEGGVSVSPAAKTLGGERTNSATLKLTAWRQFGADAVLCGHL